MSAPTFNQSSTPAAYHRTRLFAASCIALIATAMTFAIRGDIIGDLGAKFSLNNEQLGLMAGAAFWGFTISIFIGGQLCDVLGMGKLNALHVWFPGGIVIGGLVAYALTKSQLNWQIKMATILVPIAIYGLMFVGQKFPATERVQSGVTTGEMFKEALRPLFLLWVLCMLLTASTELGPNQWIPNILTEVMRNTGGAGILVLVWINGLMAIGRWFAGPIVHRMSPIGLLIGSAIFSAIGLFWLSTVQSPVPAFAAATVFAVGICYFWPTMLGVTSERFPKGGAFLLGVMGAAGNLSVALVLPIMGQIKDQYGPSLTLRYVTILPIILIVIFSALYLRDKAMGGYKAVKLSQS